MAQLEMQRPVERTPTLGRPRVRGKFLFVGSEKFWVRGVSYGTFRVDASGEEQLDPATVERDFARIAAEGFNVVRVHTGPARWVLDAAQRHGLRVMVGLNWGENMAFLGEPGRPEAIEARVRSWIRRCAGHPAVFCYSVGNEIPAALVRWQGRRRVERFIERLYRVAKEEDPDALVTYVNYPSTEYLRLPFLDLVCFNVYLESRPAYEGYLARLHSLSEDRPLLISEIGLDALRNGETKQASLLESQIRSTFRRGCVGVVVFQWTDDWYHGEHPVTDWGFGLTTRDRTPKPALLAVRRALAESPFPEGIAWPRISVIVCTYNGAATIRDTLEAAGSLDYPDYEVLVVNDGSTDGTARIAREYPVHLITTRNQGLSRARNVGTESASGSLVAFLDDDAYPDVHWLRYLALAFLEADVVGVGGPNLPPPGDGWQAEAIASAPGGPNAVLLTDRVAEHIPGCNMAFRKEALDAVGGFDARFRTAGDDVDLCWRLHDAGGVIGYEPAAMVWHHRRRSLRRYWRQQLGYGKAEALLEAKWPGRFGRLGQAAWLGRIYGRGTSLDLASLRGRVYQGVWGSAPFQSLYESRNSRWSLVLMPEWYLLVAAVAGLGALAWGWAASLVVGPALLLVAALPVAQAMANGMRARIPRDLDGRPMRAVGMRAVVAGLHLIQPLARLAGRLRGGLTPWRRRGHAPSRRFRTLTLSFWRDEREDPEDTLRELQHEMQKSGAVVRTGRAFDAWDLEVEGGLLGASRLLMAVEEHAPGKQRLRFRVTPVFSRFGAMALAVLGCMSVAAFASGAFVAASVSTIAAVVLFSRAFADVRFSGGILAESLRGYGAS